MDVMPDSGFRIVRTDASDSRANTTQHISLRELANTVTNAACDVANGVAGSLGYASNSGAYSTTTARKRAGHALSGA